MRVKKLIKDCLNHDLSDEVYVKTKDGLKKVRCICSTENEYGNPRYYTVIYLEN